MKIRIRPAGKRLKIKFPIGKTVEKGYTTPEGVDLLYREARDVYELKTNGDVYNYYVFDKLVVIVRKNDYYYEAQAIPVYAPRSRLITLLENILGAKKIK